MIESERKERVIGWLVLIIFVMLMLWVVTTTRNADQVINSLTR